MPTGGFWVIAAVAVLCLFCLAMAFYHTVRGRRPTAPVRLVHHKDCACPVCWDRFTERLVRQFDWDAAEDDLLRRQP